MSTNKVTCHNEFICCRSMPWDYNRVNLSNKVDPVPVSASLFTYGKHTVRDFSTRYLMAIVFVGDQCVIHCAFTPAIHTNYMLYHFLSFPSDTANHSNWSIIHRVVLELSFYNKSGGVHDKLHTSRQCRRVGYFTSPGIYTR